MWVEMVEIWSLWQARSDEDHRLFQVMSFTTILQQLTQCRGPPMHYSVEANRIAAGFFDVTRDGFESGVNLPDYRDTAGQRAAPSRP